MKAARWKRSAGWQPAVSPIANRRGGDGFGQRTVCGLPIRDTADCQSALQAEAVVDDLREIVALVEKEEGLEK